MKVGYAGAPATPAAADGEEEGADAAAKKAKKKKKRKKSKGDDDQARQKSSPSSSPQSAVPLVLVKRGRGRPPTPGGKNALRRQAEAEAAAQALADRIAEGDPTAYDTLVETGGGGCGKVPSGWIGDKEMKLAAAVGAAADAAEARGKS